MRSWILVGVLASICLAGCGGGGGGGSITTPTAATPTFSPQPGSFTTAQSVTLSDATSGAAIYYTTDGTAPTTSSKLYSAAISVSATTTIKAIAVATGYTNSAVASGTYTISLPSAATPTLSPDPGTYTSAQAVTLSDATSGASIYYTTDGSTPTASSTLYSAPFPVASTTVVSAIAVASGYSNSAVATGTYTIDLSATAAPIFSPAPGAYTASQSVTLSDATAGAVIYYTTDGTTPTTASTLYSGPVAVSASTQIEAIAIAPGDAASLVASGIYAFPGSATPVSVVLSTHDRTSLMAAQSSAHFAASTADAGTATVVVDATQQYQSVEGFGAAFTDSAAYLLNEVANASALSSTMSDLFSRSGKGIGLSFMRNPMGATDIARSVYSFDDQPVGSTDLSLTSFSIAHDQTDIIPIILKAKALNPDLKIMASPWSPPGWMKDPSTMSPVSMLGGGLLLSSANETAFANYFVKYIQAYQTAGIPIDYISLQNEPLNVTTSYPSMGMSDVTQLALLQNYVLPALSTNSLTTKVFVYDHNWDTPAYPEYVLSGLNSTQLAQVAGTAWHGYGGAPGAQQIVQNALPTMGTWMTEHSGGTWVSDQFTNDFLEITQVMRNSAKVYVKWSLALDQNLGPNLTQDASLGGCNTCTPIVTVNNSTGAITKDIEFYTLGHYSKYVLPGAVRIFSSNTPSIATVAFENPDGTLALIAFNNSSTSQSFNVQWGSGLAFSTTLPALGAATYTWGGTQSGMPAVAATAQIQGSSFSGESGLETETTSDTTGEYDLGYVTQGSYAVYSNVDFGSSVSQVSVRAASAGNGGTAEFYLDSVSGSPIATATLPVTGGWQSWTTVTASVSGAPSGVHTLYVVFNGTTSSIANVNWFQFQ